MPNDGDVVDDDDDDDLLQGNEILRSLEESMADRGGFVSTFTLPAGDGDADGSLAPPALARTNSGRSAHDIFRCPSPKSSPPFFHSPLSVKISPLSLAAPPPPPDLLSPQSVASDCTEMMGNVSSAEATSAKAGGGGGRHKFMLPPSSSSPRDGAAWNVSSPSALADHPAGHRHRSSPNDKAAHCKPKSKAPPNNKRKKVKPSSRKNNLVILPWNYTPFQRTTSDLSDAHCASSHHRCYQYHHQHQHQHQQHPQHQHQQQQQPQQQQPPSKSCATTLPPPHPLTCVQSYPPHAPPHHVAEHKYPQHSYSHSFASASSSEATPITSPARRHGYSVSSVDISSVMSEDNNSHPHPPPHEGNHRQHHPPQDSSFRAVAPRQPSTTLHQHHHQQKPQRQHPHQQIHILDADEEQPGGMHPLRFDRQSSAGTDDDPYFQDFDDTLSKDSMTNGGANGLVASKETDLIGVNIRLENYDVRGCNHNNNNNTPIVDVIPSSMSTNSLLGLTILPHMNPQKHRQLSSLQYSPSTLVTFADGNGNALPVIPTEMLMEQEERILLPRTDEVGYIRNRDDDVDDDADHDGDDDMPEEDEPDDDSSLSNPPGYTVNDTLTAVPRPHFHRSTRKQQQRHHRRHSSLASCSDSASIDSLESLHILHYPNPDPLFFREATAVARDGVVGNGSPPPLRGMSPLDSSYSYEEDRSLCEEEKMFVQQIHNSGLSSLSFERVEDMLENTSMEVEMELVYNSGSFDNGSVGGGASVESAGGTSVMSVEERKEIERRIHCYRKFRQKQNSRVSDVPAVSVSFSSLDNEHATVQNAAIIPPCVPETPLATNRASQRGFRMPDDNAIDEFNREQEDNFESLEMIPLADTTNSSNITHDVSDSEHIDVKESQCYPNRNPGWRTYFYLRNFLWWWQLQLPSFTHVRVGSSNSARTRPHSKYDYTYKGFDDVDFDRNSFNCCSCCRQCLCPGKTRDRFSSTPYMQTGCGKMFLIACLCLLMGWIFSDGGLKKHRSREPYADPLAPDLFEGKHRIIDDADDFDSNPMSRPEDDDFDGARTPVTHSEDDDLDFSFAQQYFPSESQSGPVVDDDVFKRFDMEDDLFDRSNVHGVYTSPVTPVEQNRNDDASILNDAAHSILAGFGVESGQQYPLNEIDTIVVLGERHVGLEWLVGKLKVLYPSVTVSSGFPSENPRDGMWFQPEADIVSSATMSKHILVIALFVNPYDWVELMRIDPIYAPNHVGMEWKAFVEAEWSPISYVNISHHSIERNGAFSVYPKTENAPDKRILDDDDDADWDDRVSEQTSPRQRTDSSRWTDPKVDTNRTTMGDSVAITSKPVSYYELKMSQSGYYGSILELRADKIRAAVKGSLYRPDVYAALPVRYEDLLQPYKDSESSSSLGGSNSSSHLPGIVGLIGRIQSLAGMSPNAELSKSFFPDPIGCDRHVCYSSIEKMRQNAEYIAYMNDHLDWHAEQLMGYQKLSSHPKPSVSRIVVLGERHSRAEWLVDRLSRCFPGIEVTYGFSRPGKFFQSPTANAPNTLVVAIFVNPYDWVEQMRRNPINAPAHVNMQWTDFVTSPWERTRSHLDSVVLDASVERCSFDFSFHEIIPCHTQRHPDSVDFPLYELRHPPDGGFDAAIDRAYSSLLDLRADKIQNFLSTVHYPGVVHLIKLRYEDLVWDSASYTDDASYLTLPFPGIAGLLESIRDHTTLTPDVSAGWILDEKGFFKAEPLSVGMDLDEDYVNWMEKHVNWSVEALVGYGT